MEGIPDALGAARENLASGRGRAVATFHTEKAIETMPGIADLCRTAVEMAADADEQTRARVTAAADAGDCGGRGVHRLAARRAAAEGRRRLPPRRDLYERKFHHSLKATITPAELERRASAAYDEVRAEMLRLARELWPTWIGDEPMPDDGDALTRRVLDAIGQDHPKADELLDFCRGEHERIEAFIRERDLIGLADEPLQIIWTPPFLRAFGGAMLIPPGPLDKGLDSFFAITPPPEDWSEEQVESMLRENNSRALRVLTIHEAVPGHYLQLAWSNRCDSLARAVFGSGVFAEGWAVYVTQVMMDAGYGADDPALMLAHWKYFLRATTNTLMDIRIHTGVHDRGGGDGADGRGWIPGALRGGREVEPRAPVEHAAVLVLPRERGDDRARARGSAPGGRRLLMAPLPRVGDQPRHAADAGHPRHPLRRLRLLGRHERVADGELEQRWPTVGGLGEKHAAQVDVGAVDEQRERHVLGRQVKQQRGVRVQQAGVAVAGEPGQIDTLHAEPVVVVVEIEHRATGCVGDSRLSP